MEMAMKFITAAAWLWGSLMAICILANVISHDSESNDRTAGAIRSGILAWAWLLARYFL